MDEPNGRWAAATVALLRPTRRMISGTVIPSKRI